MGNIVNMLNIQIDIKKTWIEEIHKVLQKYALALIVYFLVLLSITTFLAFYFNGLGLAYNDARSHLDIGRRVVEGLKPGLAQVGSVWLPLPHVLMIPTVWNDFMWHSGLAGALQSMISFIAIGILIFLFLREMGVGLLSRFLGVLIFAANVNVLYLQSTAMTELLLLATMTAGVYYVMLWMKRENLVDLIKSAFWIMMSTMVRYDGWFLLLFATGLIAIYTFTKKGYKTTEGVIILFSTLGAFGIALWFLWNLLIFKDPLYFVFGPFSAHAQQLQLEEAGNLATKGDILLSAKIYLHALVYNSYTFTALIGIIGAFVFWFDKKIHSGLRLASTALTAPLFFNIIALYFGFSVLFIQGLSGNTWFNVRYGIMLAPSIAIFAGLLIDRLRSLRSVLVGLSVLVLFFAIANVDAVTIDDAKVGSSQKNVTEVSGWLRENATNEKGFVLISAASHDAIIFSSGLPMKQFIHEGTGRYWEEATTTPERWARWIIMRTHDDNDLTWKAVSKTPGFERYSIVGSYPFADIYEQKDEYLSDLITEPILTNNK